MVGIVWLVGGLRGWFGCFFGGLGWLVGFVCMVGLVWLVGWFCWLVGGLRGWICLLVCLVGWLVA